MSGLHVAPFTGTAAEWDVFVARAEGGTAFHRYGWRTVHEQVYGHDCPFLAARDAAGALRGVLPLVFLQSPLFGRYLVSMPYVNYGGPLGDAEAVRALAAAATELASERRVKLLELRSRVALPLDLAVSHRKITVVLDLPDGGPDALFKSFSAKLRSQVRRPQKEGMTVQWGRGEVDPFFDVFAAHMRDLGTPTQPRRLFATITDVFGDDVWVATVRHEGRAVAAGFALRWGREVEITWASALESVKKLAPNMLLYWAMLERAATEGFAVFNFGRCSPGAGTHRFKQQWGSRDEQLWWYQQSAVGESAAPSPDDARYSWGPRLWKKLPVPVATALGPMVVRGIP